MLLYPPLKRHFVITSLLERRRSAFQGVMSHVTNDTSKTQKRRSGTGEMTIMTLCEGG